MTNPIKSVKLNKLEFDQLYVYIQQVIEVTAGIRKRYKKKLDITDRLNALLIHSKILDEYTQSLIRNHNITDLPNLDNPE